ncbi:type II toxin-antitoxin system YafQ family toxin [Lactobacillus bombicola]|nr:type II toxin-antitoxin system YafQ family toxin [Lactobacillus bombicola]
MARNSRVAYRTGLVINLYQIKDNELILYLVDTGSHSQLFDK